MVICEWRLWRNKNWGAKWTKWHNLTVLENQHMGPLLNGYVAFNSMEHYFYQFQDGSFSLFILIKLWQCIHLLMVFLCAFCRKSCISLRGLQSHIKQKHRKKRSSHGKQHSNSYKFVFHDDLNGMFPQTPSQRSLNGLLLKILTSYSLHRIWHANRTQHPTTTSQPCRCHII